MDDFIKRYANSEVVYKKIRGKAARKILKNFPGSTEFPGGYVVCTVEKDGAQFYWTDAMFYRMFGCLQTPEYIHSIELIKHRLHLCKERERRH